MVIAFDVFVSVVEPAPRSARPLDDMAADCVTAVAAVIDSVLDVAVTAEFNATVPP